MKDFLFFFLRLTWTGRRMLRWTETSVWRSNHSTVVTCKHASSTSLSIHPQLTGGDTESEELGRYGAALPEGLAPDILVPMMPYGAPPAPDTSVANATAAAGHRWTTAPVRCDSCHFTQCFLQNLGSKMLEAGTACHRTQHHIHTG
jgi:hypothetical protein